MSTNTPGPALPPLPDLAKVFREMFHLGQTYWQQADSDSTAAHRRSDETKAKFIALSNTTVAAVEAYALKAVEAREAEAEKVIRELIESNERWGLTKRRADALKSASDFIERAAIAAAGSKAK